MKKAIALFAAIMLAVTALTGCGKASQNINAQQEQEAANRKTMEMKQNDYRGGITRMKAVQGSIIKVMDTMKGNNTIIREDNPNSFWYTEGYQDFVATFLDVPLIDDTIWFNEEEGDWETTMRMMCSRKNNFNIVNTDSETGYSLACKVTRNEKDDYLVSDLMTEFTILVNGRAKTYKSEKSQCRVLYDSDKDWCKAYLTQTIDEGIPDVTTQMVEYMRIDNDTFAVQTSRERLLVKLQPAEQDTDIRERVIKEFYYSKLVQEGMRTTFDPWLPLPETDEAMGKVLDDNIERNRYMDSYKEFNENGDIATLYGQRDSVFFRNPQDVTVPEKFVFEDKSLQQAICYKDGVLVVTTYNKLSKAYERFTYAMKEIDGEKVDSRIADELEKMVAINKLVGIQQLPEGDEAVTVKEDTVEDKKDKTDSTEKEIKTNDSESDAAEAAEENNEEQTEEVTETASEEGETTEAEKAPVEAPAE